MKEKTYKKKIYHQIKCRSVNSVKQRKVKAKRTNISLTNEELTMMRYFLSQVFSNIELDASDMDDQVYRDNGNILIQFSRDRMEDVRSLIDKITK